MNKVVAKCKREDDSIDNETEPTFFNINWARFIDENIHYGDSQSGEKWIYKRASVSFKTQLKFWLGCIVTLGIAYPFLKCAWYREFLASASFGGVRCELKINSRKFAMLWYKNAILTVLSFGLWSILGCANARKNKYLDKHIKLVDNASIELDVKPQNN